jgi:hypothetical protein
MAPWINTGQQANQTLAYLMGLKPNSPNAYQAPTPNPSQAARDALVGAPDSRSAIQAATARSERITQTRLQQQAWGAQAGIPLEYIPDYPAEVRLPEGRTTTPSASTPDWRF